MNRDALPMLGMLVLIAVAVAGMLELCASDEKQAERAVAVWWAHKKRWPRASLRTLAVAYASGDARRETAGGHQIADLIATACRKIGVVCGQVPRWKGPPS